MDKQHYIQKASEYFNQGYACSQAVLLAFSSDFGVDQSLAKRISATFGGGMGRLRLTCGALTGAFMVVGLAYGNEDPKDMETKLHSYRRVRFLHAEMVNKFGSANCKELLQTYATREEVEKRKHHQVICQQLVETMTGLVFDEISNKL